MNTKIILTASLIAVFTIGLYAESAVAFAQYPGNVGSDGQTGSYTLEEPLDPQIRRIAEANPSSGSGTPVISADAVVVGAAVIVGTVFGGIAGVFFLKGRSGKYAAMGRG